MHTTDSDDGSLHRAQIVHSYGREQMIAEGELMDVSRPASLAGFVVPVAMTRAAWIDCVEWADEAAKAKALGQGEAGRLWDVLWLAGLAVAVGRGPRRLFAVQRVPQEKSGTRARRVSLVMQMHAGDRGEPVVTIMLPWEE